MVDICQLAREVVEGARRVGIKPDENRLLREEEVRKLSGVKGRSTRWRLEREGTFPRRRQIGENSIGWLLSDLLEWLGGRRDWSPGAPSPEASAPLSSEMGAGSTKRKRRRASAASAAVAKGEAP